ncbi:MAG: hypothetical protein CMM55_15750 [Rhodospirillaceae bacterium]|nr:hypothetical protein [Rhodospirillaceae bacterium]
MHILFDIEQVINWRKGRLAAIHTPAGAPISSVLPTRTMPISCAARIPCWTWLKRAGTRKPPAEYITKKF